MDLHQEETNREMDGLVSSEFFQMHTIIKELVSSMHALMMLSTNGIQIVFPGASPLSR